MNIDILYEMLKKSWCKETCYPNLKNSWTKNNPSLGQCAVTALIVNDFFGGKIMKWNSPNGSHYYNLINNQIIDLTKEQFLGSIPLYECGIEQNREKILDNSDTMKRYYYLLKLVKYNISLNNRKNIRF